MKFFLINNFNASFRLLAVNNNVIVKDTVFDCPNANTANLYEELMNDKYPYSEKLALRNIQDIHEISFERAAKCSKFAKENDYIESEGTKNFIEATPSKTIGVRRYYGMKAVTELSHYNNIINKLK